MVTTWRRVSPEQLSAYFAWYEAVPGFIHFLRGEQWKCDNQGWMFKTTIKKHLELQELCISFEESLSPYFKKYWLKRITSDPAYWIIVKKEPRV